MRIKEDGIWLSKSDITLFLEDEKAFREVNFEGVEYQQSYWQYVGESLHSFNEFFFSAVRVDEDKIIVPKIPDRFIKNRHVRLLVKNFIGMELDRFEKLKIKKYFYPKFIEKKFFNNELKIYGIVDRVDYDDNGLAQLVELKSALTATAIFEIIFYYLVVKDQENISNVGKVIDVRNGKCYSFTINDEAEKYVKLVVEHVREKVKEILDANAKIGK